MSKALRNTRFFIGDNVQTWLTEYFKDEPMIPMNFDSEFIIDVIDSPLTCYVFPDGNGTLLEISLRKEWGGGLHDLIIGIYKEETLKYKILKDSGELGDETTDIGRCFMSTAIYLFAYVEKNGLTESLSNIDVMTEGFITEIENGALTFKRVAGKDRPDMAYLDFFGSVEVGRPFEDEFLERTIGSFGPATESEE